MTDSGQRGELPIEPSTGPAGPISSLMVKAATGLFTGLIGSFAGKSLVFLLQVLVSRIYGPAFFGLFVTALLVCHIMQVVSSLGVQKGGMRFLAIAHERDDRVAMLQIQRIAVIVPLIVGTLMAIACYALAPFIAVTCFKKPELVDVLRSFAFGIPFFSLLRTASELTRGFKTAKFAVLVEDLLMPALQIGLFATFHALGFGFSSVAYSFVLSNLICSVLMFFTSSKLVLDYAPHADLKPSKHHETSGWKPLLRFSLPLLPLALLLNLNNSVDLIMLNLLTPPSEVGQYAAAARLVILFALITQPMKQIFAPLIAGQYGMRDIGKIQVLYRTSSRWMLILTLPVFTFLFLAREPLMMIFGEGFTGAGAAVLGILAMGAFLASVVGVAGDMLTMSGHQYLELACISGGLVLNFVMNLLLIPHYGIIGAAIATSSSSMATDLARILIVACRYGIHPFSAGFLAPGGVALSALLFDLVGSRLFSMNMTRRLLVAAAAVSAVFLGSLYKGLTPADRELFQVLKRKLGKADAIPATVR